MRIAIRVGIAAAAAAAAIWFVGATEWVETEIQMPPKGEAARDTLYAARKLLANFGMQVQSRTGLETLPPPGARLLLTSSHWDLIPSRPRQLQDWVRRGGHLVIPAGILDREVFDWVPVDTSDRPPVRGERKRLADDHACRKLKDGAQTLDVCGWPHWRDIVLPQGVNAQWRLQGEAGIEALRVPFGAGTVTVVGPESAFSNRYVLRTDNPLLFASAMQADRGALAWVVSEESREPFVPWLWHEAWVAIALVVCAIAAGLWRTAVRFGPVAQPRHVDRRSIAEQVAGTARFLLRRAPAALHAAQLEALHEAARQRIAGYAFADASSRVAKLAAGTGLARPALEDAMRPTQDGRRLAARLQLMETARRRLLPTPSHRSEDQNNADQT